MGDTNRISRASLAVPCKTPAQKLVLLVLTNRGSRTGSCHPSYERLCQDTGLSRATVARSLLYLRDDLKVIFWKQGHSNQYMKKAIANLYTFDVGETPTTQDTTTQDIQLLKPTTALPPASVQSKTEGQDEPAKVNRGALSLTSELSKNPYTVQLNATGPTLADIFPQLTPAHQREHFKRTDGKSRAEQLSVAAELLMRQQVPNQAQ